MFVGSDRLVIDGFRFGSVSFWIEFVIVMFGYVNRLSAGGISEGRLSSTWISTAGISTARISSAAGLSSAVCASVRSASSAAAKFNGTWMFGRMVSSLSLSVCVEFECGESNRVDLVVDGFYGADPRSISLECPSSEALEVDDDVDFPTTCGLFRVRRLLSTFLVEGCFCHFNCFSSSLDSFLLFDLIKVMKLPNF